MLVEEIYSERFLFETKDGRCELAGSSGKQGSAKAKIFADFVYFLFASKYKSLSHAEHVKKSRF